jgi:glyoxalase family protein
VADTGTIGGTHHLTMCVGPAQEDYDFHVRVLGLRSVKKTVLFDGEIPIYHLYYGNDVGDVSTLLTSFPYRQAGWMGERGTNQAKQINLSVPPDSIGWWSDHLSGHGIAAERAELFGRERLLFSHPCGIPYALVGDLTADDRIPPEHGPVPDEHGIRGAYGTTTSVRAVGEMDFFLREGVRAELVGSEGPNHQYRLGPDSSHGRMLELVEEPDRAQGTWHFGEGTIHHHAFDALNDENQMAIKDWLVGLGFTDISEKKDRGYFFSMYCRTPSGLLLELCHSGGRGFFIDETAEELGTHMCIPPHWEHRRAELDQLEKLDTVEAMAAS